MRTLTPNRFRTRLRRSGALAGIWLVLGTACSPGPDRAPIVLIVVDTLRADRAHAPDSMPALSHFASQGVSFVDAMAASSWTGASMAAIATGRYPDEVGVRRLRDPLPGAALTAAEILSGAGYHTVAVVSNAIAGPDFGYDQGFDEFRFRPYKAEPVPPERSGRPSFTAEQVTDEALDLLAGLDRSYFLYVHYTDPHDPYLAPPRWREAASAADDAISEERLLALPDLRPEDVATEIESIEANYDAEAAFVDSQIARLLAAIPDDAIVCITSDHGDEFLEHGGLLHATTLYQELIHVPLLLKGTGVPSQLHVDRLASHVDILPTLLDLAGVAAPDELTGRSLRSAWEDVRTRVGSEVSDPRPIFAMMGSGDDEQRVARAGRWKLYRSGGPSSSNSPETLALFDLLADPSERHNRAAAHPEIVRTLLRSLSPAPESEIEAGGRGDERAAQRREEALRNLGYIE